MKYNHNKKFLDYFESNIKEVLEVNRDLTDEELEAKYRDILAGVGFDTKNETLEEAAKRYTYSKFYCYALNARKGMNIRQMVDTMEDWTMKRINKRPKILKLS